MVIFIAFYTIKRPHRPENVVLLSSGPVASIPVPCGHNLHPVKNRGGKFCPAFAFITVISPFRQLIDRRSQCVQDQLSPAFD